MEYEMEKRKKGNQIEKEKAIEGVQREAREEWGEGEKKWVRHPGS